jgi:hypothetical protein
MWILNQQVWGHDCIVLWALTLEMDNFVPAGGSNPGGGEIFRTRPERPWGLLSLLYNGYRVFPGGKAAGARC